MVVSASKYEEIRQQRLAQNKKRMEELNLVKLSGALSPKKSPLKHTKPRVPRPPAESVPVRRSSRFAEKPPVSYKEFWQRAPEPVERPRRSYSYQRRDLLNRVYASDEVRAYAIDRAEILQSGLDSAFPSFVKPMLQSHVTGGFWLGLPVQFCKDHLPSRDEIIKLVDENGDESDTKYLVEKTGLSAGWRGFAIDHRLVDGDALVFQLVSPTQFKVFIIRGNEYEEDSEMNQQNEEREMNQQNEEEKGNRKRKEKDANDLKNTGAGNSDRKLKRTRASRK